MSRSLLPLAALALATSLPAFAGLLSSPMAGVIDYPGSPQDISADFVLYNASGNEIFRVGAEVQSVGGVLEVGTPLAQSPFHHLSDTEWCLEVDATNANNSVTIDYFTQQDGNNDDTVWGDNSNISGSVGDLCNDATLVQ